MPVDVVQSGIPIKGALMLQGAGSDVGKSVLTAGLCRIARRRGIRVAPFKPQNMSNNAAVTADGGEIGRAQAMQARAAGIAPHTDFNPVLLKPESDRRAQVVVHGRVRDTQAAADYMARRDMLLGAVMESYERLRESYDLVLVEGAGSPAETNLRARDIANMGFARKADVPVVIIGDIDRGGVIASLVGTQTVLAADDAAMVAGFIVNKFRGDPALFKDGRDDITARTGWRDFGLVPWLPAAARLPAEDAVVLGQRRKTTDGRILIAAPMLSRIANLDDADPFLAEPNVDLRFIPPGQPIPRDADVVLLLGTKNTRADMQFMRDHGWDIDVLAHARAGGRVIGLCGGYQMLGREILDPQGVEGAAGSVRGLSLLDVTTTMAADKTVRASEGRATDGSTVSGYEIHMGETTGTDCARAFLHLDGHADGAMSSNGRIAGCYLHGLFASDDFRRNWLNDIRTGAGSELDFEASVEQALDALADHLEASLDVNGLFALAAQAR
ncbi:MAG: cobyric acid synthase [Burkholderiales bacterium]|nr:MAG: cobyric acid synthase [Burkholderiales bacterium]